MDERLREKESKFVLQTKTTLQSKDEKRVLLQLRDLKVSGNVSIMPFVLDLLVSSNSEDIIQEVLQFVRDLKDQKCVPVIVEYIDGDKVAGHIGGLVSSCWQSRLDFSGHLKSFARCFLKGNYQTALEAFTVIEEMLWKSTDKNIQMCRKILVDNADMISEEKKPLYLELIKVLEEGKSENSELYPDLYK
jgi:hypothetical protein